MKKFSPVNLFFAGSVLILVIFSLLFWNYYQNNPENIDHVRLEEWSQPVELATNIPSVSYDVLFSEGELNLFAIQEDRDSREKFLSNLKLDYYGEVKEELEIDRAGQLSFPRGATYNNNDFLFYFSGESSSNQILKSIAIDTLEGNILNENIGFPNALNLINSQEMMILTYTEKSIDTNDDIITVIGFNPDDQQKVFKYSFPFELQARYPKLAIIENKLLMIWHERNPDTMFISGQEGTINRYHLKAGELDIESGELVNVKILADAYGNSAANIDIKQKYNEVWISWVEYNRELEQEIINIGILDGDLEFKNISNRVGFNPAISLDSSSKRLVNLSRSELQTALFLNDFTGNEIELIGQRIFPDLHTSRAPKLLNYQGENHLFWTEAATTSRDIFYSNTAVAEDIKIFELLGFASISSPMELVSSLILFFGYPILVFNLAIINYYIPIIIVIVGFYILGKISRRFYELKNSTPYLSFLTLITGIILFIWLAQGDIQFLFSITNPPAGQKPLIIGIVTLITIAFIHLIRYDEDHSIYIGFGSVFLWFYWLTQAGLVYEFYQYFI